MAATMSASQATQTQQTQESDAYAMYDSSFDVERTFARFVSLTNTDRVPTLVLPRREPGHVYKFGRHHSCDFQLSGGRFSNVHFKVWEEIPKNNNGDSDVQSVIMVQDMSTNGTFLNQARIGKGNMTVLTNGDELAAGVGVAADEVRFLVQLPPSSRLVQKNGLGSLGSATNGLDAEAQRCMSKYEIRQILGSGAFATVRACIDRSTGRRYAVKILNQRKLAITNANAKAAELFRREIEILQSTKHPNIVQYVDMWHDARDIYLVLEFLDGGDLMDYIMRRGRLDELASVHIVAQILDALCYCHRIGIAHRDIKPENILLTATDPPQAKLTDFGLAKMVEPGSFLKTFCGTLTYVAPEVITMHGRIEGAYSMAVDMWSVGCVAFICVAGSMPFVAEGQEGMMGVISRGEFDMEALDAIALSGPGVDFIQSCLRVDPAKRITGDAALAHPWITEAEARAAEAEGQRRQGGGWTGEEEYGEDVDRMETDGSHRRPSSSVAGASSSRPIPSSYGQSPGAPRSRDANIATTPASRTTAPSPGGPNHGIESMSAFGFDKSPFRLPMLPANTKENRPPGVMASPRDLRYESTVTPLKKHARPVFAADGGAVAVSLGAGPAVGTGGYIRPVTPLSHTTTAKAGALDGQLPQTANAVILAGAVSRFSNSSGEEDSPLRRSTLMPTLPRPVLPTPAQTTRVANAEAGNDVVSPRSDNTSNYSDDEDDTGVSGGLVPGSSRYVSAIDYRPSTNTTFANLPQRRNALPQRNGHNAADLAPGDSELGLRLSAGLVDDESMVGGNPVARSREDEKTGYVTAPLANTAIINAAAVQEAQVGLAEKRGVVRPRESDDSLNTSHAGVEGSTMQLDAAVGPVTKDATTAGNGVERYDDGQLERRETKRLHLDTTTTTTTA